MTDPQVSSVAADSPTVEPLTARQAAFVQEYLIDNNGTQAAIRAGYSDVSAGSAASALLMNPKVVAAVAAARAQRLSRVQMKQDDVILEMSLLSHSRIDHYYVDDEGQVKLTDGAPSGAMAAIKSIRRKKTERFDAEHNLTTTYDVEITLWDKPAPLKLMGRHVGLFPDRVEHTGKDGGPIDTVTRIERVIIDPAQEKKP
jgi:phage terminase small subunit